MVRHFLSLLDWSKEELSELLERGAWMKKQLKEGVEYKPLKGKTLAMIFDKSSTRTRVSFEVGMFQLGGHAINITSSSSQLGRGETYADTARVLSRYVDAIMVRTYEQNKLEEMARNSTVPVINGLTDLLHPCQVMADIMTVIENKGDINGLKISYVGDGNNMANTWIEAAMVFGFELRIATPRGFEPAATILGKIKGGGYPNIHVGNDPKAAVKEADVINTDTWVSMGQEKEDVQSKIRLFKPFQVNMGLLELASPDVIVLHCLPAHREDEITSEVMDGPHSRIFEQAENRLHIQKAILQRLLS